jgi:hypothetical protein
MRNEQGRHEDRGSGRLAGGVSSIAGWRVTDSREEESGEMTKVLSAGITRGREERGLGTFYGSYQD